MSKSNSITSVGMDVHKKSINVAVVLPGSSQVAEEWQLANEPRAIKRLVKKLKRLSPGEAVACYEAGPCGYTSGENTRRGHTTKAGNSHVRRILVEAAKHYRHRPTVSVVLRKPRAGQPEAVIAIADRAHSRLHRRYYKLKEGSRKHSNVATTAVARELAGFIWAVMRHEELSL